MPASGVEGISFEYLPQPVDQPRLQWVPGTHTAPPLRHPLPALRLSGVQIGSIYEQE